VGPRADLDAVVYRLPDSGNSVNMVMNFQILISGNLVEWLNK